MASEWSPPSRGTTRMTNAQVRKYIEDMKKAQAEAERKIKAAQDSWELEQEKKEVAKLEEMLDDDSFFS